MRSPGFRVFGLFALAILVVGSPGVDVNHGVVHESAHDSYTGGHDVSHDEPLGIHAEDHADDHGHPSVDSGLRERSSGSAFLGSSAATVDAARLIPFVSPLRNVPASWPRSEHSTGPPPSLRAPPAR